MHLGAALVVAVLGLQSAPLDRRAVLRGAATAGRVASASSGAWPARDAQRAAAVAARDATNSLRDMDMEWKVDVADAATSRTTQRVN